MSRVLILAAITLLAMVPSLSWAQVCETCDTNQTYFAQACETCNTCDSYCWLDGLELFAGLDGSKQPQDFGVNAHFGGRLHANWGVPIFRDSGFGIQVGTAVTQTKHAVAVTQALEGSNSRTQSFTTLGMFQRSPSGWNWGVVYDHLYEDDYDRVSLDQLRGQLSYQLTEYNELGFIGMLPLDGADATWAANNLYLRPIAQGRFFYRHWWESGAHTTLWLGMAEPHGQANAALSARDDSHEVVVFGSDFQAPLNNYFALFGEANFVTPADTGTVDAYLGIAFYPGGGALGWQRRRSSPLLPVAGSPSFSTDLTTR